MREQVERVTCDLCGYGGAFSRPGDFTTRDGVDLCHWCATDPAPIAYMECGRHRVTFGPDWSWSCSCGHTSVAARLTVALVPARVLAAVPNLRYALARIHSET